MKGRFWLIAPWALFLLIALGWMAYWLVVADAAERNVAHWRDAENARGAEVSYTRVVSHGFPVLMRLEVDGFAYRPRGASWRVETQRFDLNVEMLNTEHVMLQARAPIAIAHADGSRTTISARNLLAGVRTSQGALAMAGVEADDLIWTDYKAASTSTPPPLEGEGAGGGVNRNNGRSTTSPPPLPLPPPGGGESQTTRITKFVLNVRPDPRASNQMQAALSVNGLTLARPVRGFERFGQSIAQLESGIVLEQANALTTQAPSPPLPCGEGAGGEGRGKTHGVTEESGRPSMARRPSSPTPPPQGRRGCDILDNWRAAGGRVRIEFLQLNWGPLAASGQGDVALDDQRRLAGTLRLAVPHPAPALSALADNDALSHNTRQLLQAIAAGLARSGRQVTFTIIARDGVLRVENVPVRELGVVY